MDAARQDEPGSQRAAECAGCGGALYLSDTVIAWWPVHPRWVPGSPQMAFMHERCAAPLRSFEVKPPQTLAQVLSDS
jgi:hypothetical protein